jgi:uncharacterized membrane protein YfcA
MDELLIPLWSLAILFFGVSLAYSAVGLGGGSSYTALLAIVGASQLMIPATSLTLNLMVTFIGSVSFFRARHVRVKLILPFLVASIPMSYLGGSLKLPEEVFYWVLTASLVLVAVRIYAWKNTKLDLNLDRRGKLALSLLLGGLLGLIAGMVGIGGGIYLVPLIIIFGLGSEKEAAACGAVFIWINSLSGLIPRLHCGDVDLVEMLPLLIAVAIGGTIGSHIGSAKLAPKTMQKWLGAIIIVAIGLLLRKLVMGL